MFAFASARDTAVHGARRSEPQTRESKMKNMRKMMKNQAGQGMTEYIIIVALIAIAAIGVVTLFGDNIRRMFGASVDALAGTADASTGAKKAASSSTHRNVTNFAGYSTMS